MNENFVTLETAYLAQEKGFSFPKSEDPYIHGRHFYFHWWKDVNKYHIISEYDIDHKDNLAWRAINLPAPRQATLQTWLREKHNYHIEIKAPEYDVLDWNFAIFSIGDWGNKSRRETLGYKSYKDALEAALLATLELI